MIKETAERFALRRYRNYDDTRSRLIEKYPGFERLAIEDIMIQTLSNMISQKEAQDLEPKL